MTIKNYILDKNVFPHEEGDIRVYLDEDGKNITGQISVYYDTGEMAAIFEVEKGKKNGKYTEFYKNNTIKVNAFLKMVMKLELQKTHLWKTMLQETLKEKPTK
jgi:antitoxin component YwqK of YwqJK toxin-antitoxin module